MKKSRLLSMLCIVAITVLSGPSYASVIYTYTGNNFDDFTTPSSYNSTMSLTGTVELDTALIPNMNQIATPVSFSFNDGINTLTDINAKIDYLTSPPTQIVTLSDGQSCWTRASCLLFRLRTNTCLFFLPTLQAS